MNIVLNIKKTIQKLICRVYHSGIRKKINNLRKNDVISVLFVLNDVSKWKSEDLYIKMLNHPRFNPILGVTIRMGESPLALSRKVLDLVSYLESKNYEYIELTNKLKPSPDIVIYTEPYAKAVPKKQSIYSYLSSVFICINYSSHTTHLSIDYHSTLHEYAWLDCYESKLALEDAYKYIGHKRKSIQLTGLPMLDILLDSPLSDPWKPQKHRKKRIIWAPHHSIGGFDDETIIYGNFMDMYELMFELAFKYKDQIQIAFKPHPLLREKLEKLWGTPKTTEYYEKWANLDNGQLEEGSYVDLFKNSDALIHDSSSFMVEYQLLNKPTLFIVRNEPDIIKDLNAFGLKVFYSQKLVYNALEVETFIQDIISEKDELKQKRVELMAEVLSHNGKSASENIIKCILEG